LLAEHPFIKCINNNFLCQLVEEPTRGENILDLVLATDETLVEQLRVEEPFENSDHRMIKFVIVCKHIRSNNSETKYNYFRADYCKIREFISNSNLDHLSNLKDVEQQWANIKKEILAARDQFVPKNKISKKRSKWVNKKVLKCRTAKNKAWKSYIKSNRDSKLYDIYKSKLNESVKVNRSAKIEFEKKLASNVKKDSKSFYAYIRSKQRNKVKVGPVKDDQNNIITDDAKTADLLNDYFASVFTVEDLSNMPKVIGLNKNLPRIVSNLIIDDSVVHKKLSELNVNKSPGPDQIHPKLLYELRNELAKPLAYLFNLSLEYSIIPQEWRQASVVPLFKKGKKEKCENYRPVSLTCIICKILESIIKDKLIEHFDKYKLIRDSQHGFTKNRSCLTNLLDFFETVTKNLDDGDPVDLVYLDFAKAFDKVPYQRLFLKLESLGIQGKVLDWIKEWLANRKQRVSLNNTFSSWRDVTSGVPQGSVLGPILFVVYINDLDNNIISKINKFADDTKLGKAVGRVEDRISLQNDLDKLFNWSTEWQMKFNTDKCAVIHLGSKNTGAEYLLGNEKIKSSSNERDLGVIIDNKLNFSEHCDHIIKQANSTLGLIKRTIKYKSKDTIVRLYKGLVRPKLDYCVQVWRPYLKKDISSLEQVQHRATKMITEIRRLDYETRLRKCNLISLEERRTRGDLIQVFKIVKGIDKLNFNHFFEYSNYSSTRGHKYKLVKKRCKFELRRNFFSQRIVDIWNKLPEAVVEAENVNIFKNRLDKLWAGFIGTQINSC